MLARSRVTLDMIHSPRTKFVESIDLVAHPLVLVGSNEENQKWSWPHDSPLQKVLGHMDNMLLFKIFVTRKIQLQYQIEHL